MSTGERLPQRVLIGVAALGALVHVGTLFPTAWSLLSAVSAASRPVIVAVSMSLLIAMIACALAVFLVIRAGRRYEARGLAVFLTLIAVCWGSVLRFASLQRGPDGTPTGLEITLRDEPLLLAVLALALAGAALLRLSVHFPQDLSTVGHRPAAPFRRAWVPWAIALATPCLLTPGLSLAAKSARALGIPPETIASRVPLALGIVAATIGGVVLAMVLLAVRNFVRGYRLADRESRRSALWLLVGVVGSTLTMSASGLVLAADMVLPISLGAVSRYTPVVILVSPLFMVACVAVAILYSGAVDPALALRRSTVNGIAGTLGLLVFAGLENTLSSWVEGRLGLPGALGSFLAGAVSAGVFLPVQRRLAQSVPGSTRRDVPRPATDSAAPDVRPDVGDPDHAPPRPD